MGYHPFVYRSSMPGLSDNESLANDTPSLYYANSPENTGWQQTSEEALRNILSIEPSREASSDRFDEYLSEFILLEEKKWDAFRSFVAAQLKHRAFLDFGRKFMEKSEFENIINDIQCAISYTSEMGKEITEKRSFEKNMRSNENLGETSVDTDTCDTMDDDNAVEIADDDNNA